VNILIKNYFFNITDDKKLLQEILQNIYQNIPYITCKRINNIRSIRAARINIVYKNATINTTVPENSGYFLFCYF